MMGSTLSRRAFGKLVCSAIAASPLLLPGLPAIAAGKAGPHVVVIGGGFGGAAAARNLRLLDPSLRVTLIEPKAVYHTCPFSNWVLGGLWSVEQIAHSYRTLASRYGVEVVADVAKSIDPASRKVRLGGGRVLAYDRLVVSPGVEFLWDSIPGYGRQVAESRMPHAYEAGPQTTLLRRQLLSLKDGENVIIVSPPNQFRCPAAPYERAGMIALYLKQHKPKSKVIMLDAKDGFTKQDLFLQGWERRYPGMIEWRSGSGGGKVERIDAATMTLSTEFGDEKGGVVNVIPAQRAGRIALDAGLADASGWCPVDPMTFESTLHPGIHVIGDALQGSPMPKSGTSAHTQGRVVAAVISGLFGSGAPAAARIESLCYSLIGPEYAISVRGTYSQTPQGFAENRQDVSLTSMEATSDQLAAEQVQALSWYRQITADTWG
jgi:sulfide dehydrogenase [flavocytochrome c] flavoprotein subunit